MRNPDGRFLLNFGALISPCQTRQPISIDPQNRSAAVNIVRTQSAARGLSVVKISISIIDAETDETDPSLASRACRFFQSRIPGARISFPGMTMYWVYDLPTWLFGALTVIVFVAFGLAGLYRLRGWVQRIDNGHHVYNHIVGFFLAGVTVLYAVTAGLLAIGAWATFDQDQGKIDHEASALGGLYRDTIAYPEPLRAAMQEDLRRYARQVIDVGWPMQRRGIIPNNASPVLTNFQEHFMTFEPQSERQKILAEETYRAFNDLTESRRARLNSIDAEMPGPLWTLVIAGAGICIAVTWFLHTESFIMHVWMTGLFSVLLALLIFLIAVLDNPYRGKISVSPEPLERVYQQIMSPQK